MPRRAWMRARITSASGACRASPDDSGAGSAASGAGAAGGALGVGAGAGGVWPGAGAAASRTSRSAGIRRGGLGRAIRRVWRQAPDGSRRTAPDRGSARSGREQAESPLVLGAGPLLVVVGGVQLA